MSEKITLIDQEETNNFSGLYFQCFREFFKEEETQDKVLVEEFLSLRERFARVTFCSNER